jgi:hypothetical protein
MLYFAAYSKIRKKKHPHIKQVKPQRQSKRDIIVGLQAFKKLKKIMMDIKCFFSPTPSKPAGDPPPPGGGQ